PPPISGLSLEEKPITLYSGSVKPLRVLHHRWRVQRVLKQDNGTWLWASGTPASTRDFGAAGLPQGAIAPEYAPGMDGRRSHAPRKGTGRRAALWCIIGAPEGGRAPSARGADRAGAHA
ncbi:MAG: hypothetical protein ACYTKD_13165, partial [Planctomycetota bacterium]